MDLSNVPTAQAVAEVMRWPRWCHHGGDYSCDCSLIEWGLMAQRQWARDAEARLLAQMRSDGGTA